MTFLLLFYAPLSDIIAQAETIYLLNEFYRKLTSLKEDWKRKINSARFKVGKRFLTKRERSGKEMTTKDYFFNSSF